ncbi:hypothetical protein [Nostoc sp.]
MLHRSLNYIARAIAQWRFGRRSLFYLTQRKKRRQRSHGEDFAGDGSF